jgi:DNA-binding LacI/PurR family transcriptional regulator
VTKTVTIRDVARTAGVSVATASRALNRSELVTEATRKRVLQVMDELQFTPSISARRLSLGRTMTITVVTWSLTRPQAVERLRGVDAVLSDSEFDLVIYNVETVEKRDQYMRTLPLPQRTDGVLLISLPPRPDDVARLASGAVPVVVVDVHSPMLRGLPRVMGDDVAGGELAACHLLELGHRRIGYIGDEFENPFGFTSSRDRFAGYERALAGAGLAVRPEWVALGAHGRYEARELACRLLSEPNRPTAIFAASDTQALGVIAAAHEIGLDVPGDLSIVGYDDIEAAEYVGLTTIRQRLFESGRLGAQLLLKEISHRSEVPISTDLAPDLVIRATSAPLKEGLPTG